MVEPHIGVDVSVVIPAYRELEKIPQTLELLDFDGDFEVIIAGDELPEEDVRFLRTTNARLNLSETRRGKTDALNQAAEKARGELLVFLDSDTRPDNTDFLNEIWGAYQSEKFDIGTGKLMVEGGGLLGSTINVEYMLINGVMWMGNALNTAVPINGAFIIVTREGLDRIGGFSHVVVEDVQLGLHANKLGLEFGYVDEATAYTAPAGSFREWLTQRKRWAIGGWDTLFHSPGDLARNLPLAVTSLLSCYPMFFATIGFAVLMFLTVSYINPLYVVSATAIFTSFLLFAFNRALNWGASLPSRLGYLLWYGPMWSAFIAFSLFYCTLIDRTPSDWKL